jgi:hypothetical protein
MLIGLGDAGFGAVMAWRYRNIDPAVAFCGLASVWGTLVVLFVVGKAMIGGGTW